MAARNTTPRYMQVAVDVAGRIAREELKIGQKISGRTTLASEYSVSPETIRKAMRLLEDVDIVTVKHGNGISVSSIQRAEEFIERYRIKASVNELKDELIALMRQRDQIEEKMNVAMNSIIDYTSRFKNSDHITVHEYYLGFDGEPVAYTLAALALKGITGITVVGIKRDGQIYLSPDEQALLSTGDRLLYVGTPDSSLRLGEYLREKYEL